MKYYRVEILAVQMARQLIACVEINTILLQSGTDSRTAGESVLVFFVSVRTSGSL